MQQRRRARIAFGVAVTAFVAALFGAAVVPGDAWSPGTVALSHAELLEDARVLHAQTGLTATPIEGGVMVSTGDGGGVGEILGLGGPLRVRPASFRGLPCYEIGSGHDAPATYVDDNGIRLDDGMSDRLRARAWLLSLPLALAIAAFAWSRRR